MERAIKHMKRMKATGHDSEWDREPEMPLDSCESCQRAYWTTMNYVHSCFTDWQKCCLTHTEVVSQ